MRPRNGCLQSIKIKTRTNKLKASLKATLSPAQLFAIRERQKRDPGALQSRDENLPKKGAFFSE